MCTNTHTVVCIGFVMGFLTVTLILANKTSLNPNPTDPNHKPKTTKTHL